MNLLSPLELSLFAIESPSRPSHVGGIMLFDRQEPTRIHVSEEAAFSLNERTGKES